MKSVGYYNGEIAPLEELRVPALDRAFYFGDGVYDVALIHNGKPVALDDHLDRFFSSCGLVDIEIGRSRGELTEILSSLPGYADPDIRDFTLYFQASRGIAPRSHPFPENAEPGFFAYITPRTFRDQSERISLITKEDIRFYMCNVKTICLMPNVLASEEAKRKGCCEAILHRGDVVTEGSHTAIALIKDGALVFPPLSNLILPSITRKQLIALCEENGIPVVLREIRLGELWTADEVLSMSTTSVILAAKEIDGKPVGGKAPGLVDRMQKLFFDRYGLI